MNQQQQFIFLRTDSSRDISCADPMGGGGWVQGVRTPLKNHKTIGFISNTGPEPLKNKKLPKTVSEYDQEIPQSQTADNPVAPRGRAAQPSQNTRKTN